MDAVYGFRESLHCRISLVGADENGGERGQVVDPRVEEVPRVLRARGRSQMEDLYPSHQQEPDRTGEIPLRLYELRAEFRRGAGA